MARQTGGRVGAWLREAGVNFWAWLVPVGVLHGKTQSTWSISQLPKSQRPHELPPLESQLLARRLFCFVLFQAEFQSFMATCTVITEKRQRPVLMS